MSTTLTTEQIDHLVHANSAALGLHIAADYRAGVAAYLQLAAGMAELVMGLPLGPDDESGAVFTPVAPEVGA